MVEGQRAAMRPYGIDSCVRSEVWPDAYLVTAELEPGVPIGGLRIEQRSTSHRLPLELAIEPPEVMRRTLDRRTEAGLVELCGMWVAPAAKVPHLADRLVRLGIAVAAAEGMKHVVAFGGQHSLPLALRTGFRFGRGEPVFAYPDSRYHSRVVWQRIRR